MEGVKKLPLIIGKTEINEDPALIMRLIPQNFIQLASAPTFENCIRSTFSTGSPKCDPFDLLKIATCICQFLTKIHAKGIAHGDVYAHNIKIGLVRDINDKPDLTAILYDFGAASYFKQTTWTCSALSYVSLFSKRLVCYDGYIHYSNPQLFFPEDCENVKV